MGYIWNKMCLNQFLIKSLEFSQGEFSNLWYKSYRIFGETIPEEGEVEVKRGRSLW